MPYDTQQQALAVAFSLGCPVGAHKKGDKWMPCRTDAAYEAAKAKKKGLKKMEGQKNMGQCSMCGEDIADEAQAFQAEGGQAMCQDCFMGMPDTEEEAEDAMEPEEEPEDMGKAQQRDTRGRFAGGGVAAEHSMSGEPGSPYKTPAPHPSGSQIHTPKDRASITHGSRVTVTGSVAGKGKHGIVTDVSPSGDYFTVKTPVGSHVGIYHSSDLSPRVGPRYRGGIGPKHLGGGLYKQDDDLQVATEFIKVDESLGLVFGFAVVCKVDGEDYFDLQGDHIPESAMVEAAADFMLNSRAGKEMHKGDANCQAVFAMPLTEEIAKAFGLGTPKMTGLMIAIKPIGENAADVLAKVRSGEYRGFSIGGKWLKSRSVEPVPG